MADLLTDSIEWADVSQSLYGKAGYLVGYLYDAYDEAQKAVNDVASQGDIGSLRLSVKMNEIETLNEKRRKLVSFANGIHYEIYEMVDNPFCLSLSDTAHKAYGLNPSDIKVTTGQFLFWNTNTSLTDLLVATIEDKELKNDFRAKFKALDKDKPSATLSDAMTEARFWKNEFQKAIECKAIAEGIFTKDVRNNWSAITQDERKKIIDDYVNKVGQVMYGERSWWDKLWGSYPSNIKEVNYNASGFGVANLNQTIGINPDFVSNPAKNYSVDKVIDTLTHEIRHQYQYDVRKDPKKYGVPDSLRSEWDYKNYIEYDQNINNYPDYYRQEHERDARAFASVARPSN